MMSKKTLLLTSAVLLSVLGVGVWVYAGCGACGAAPAEAATEGQVAVTKPFHVLDVTGPHKGKELCYICRNGGRPSFVVFTRSTDGHIRHLAPAIDKFVAEHKDQRLAGFVVLLGENTEEHRNKLTALAKDLKLSIPLTIALDGAKGPKSYNLPPEADTVVLVANRNRVHATITVNCAKVDCGCTKCGQVNQVVEAGKELLNHI